LDKQEKSDWINYLMGQQNMAEFGYYNEVISFFTKIIALFTAFNIVISVGILFIKGNFQLDIWTESILIIVFFISVFFISYLLYRLYNAKFRKYYIVNNVAKLTGQIMRYEEINVQEIFNTIQAGAKKNFRKLWSFYRESHKKPKELEKEKEETSPM
jgi:hypothetical protein